MSGPRRIQSHFRRLTSLERDALMSLLAVDFPGRDALAHQSQGASGRTIDRDGSVELRPLPSSPRAAVKTRVPVEAIYYDTDGTGINVLLHVLDGLLNELEILRFDSEVPQRPLAPAEFVVAVTRRAR